MKRLDRLFLYWSSEKSSFIRYGLAIALTAAGLALRLLIAAPEEGLPFITFFPAATLAAIFGGFGPGLLSTLIGVVIANTLFFPPFNQFVFSQPAFLSGLLFILDEVLVCTAIALLQHIYRRYRLAAAHLSELQAAELSACRQAERANEAKSRFLAAASHDLCQPYQAVRLYQAALEARLSDSTALDILRRMDIALTAGERMLKSIGEVSALDGGINAPEMTSIDIPEMLTALGARHRPDAEAKGLKLRIRSLPGILHADPHRLSRIMDNLVNNAIRYTDTGGVLIACRRLCNQLTLQVFDSGMGIATEHQQLVFEEFFQVDNAERNRTKGLGLGLAVATMAARSMNLSLALKSHPGKGTRLTLRFPANHPAEPE